MLNISIASKHYQNLLSRVLKGYLLMSRYRWTNLEKFYVFFVIRNWFTELEVLWLCLIIYNEKVTLKSTFCRKQTFVHQVNPLQVLLMVYIQCTRDSCCLRKHYLLTQSFHFVIAYHIWNEWSYLLSLNTVFLILHLETLLSGRRKWCVILNLQTIYKLLGKLRHGLAKGLEKQLIDKLREGFFSFNIDEATSSNLHKVLTLLVSYFCTTRNEVVVEHLGSLTFHGGGRYHLETSPLICVQINGLVSIW